MADQNLAIARRFREELQGAVDDEGKARLDIALAMRPLAGIEPDKTACRHDRCRQAGFRTGEPARLAQQPQSPFCIGDRHRPSVTRVTIEHDGPR